MYEKMGLRTWSTKKMRKSYKEEEDKDENEGRMKR